jgi:hypothetical protein
MVADAVAVWDTMAGAVSGQPPDAAVRRRAWAADLRVWRRLLAIERCGPRLDGAVCELGLTDELPADVRQLLRAETESAVRAGLATMAQLDELAALTRGGPAVIALKGAARLLVGEGLALRPQGDVDVLLASREEAAIVAARLANGGYVERGTASAHHRAPLVRAGGLAIELHYVAVPGLPILDEWLWSDVTAALLPSGSILVPSRTAMVLHALAHASELEWEVPLRLRAVLDVAQLWDHTVDEPAVLAFVRSLRGRRTAELVLGAASRVNGRVPSPCPGALRTLRRVGRARAAAATLPAKPVMASRLMRYAGALAASPRALGRLVAAWPRRLRWVAATSCVAVASCDGSLAPRLAEPADAHVLFASPVDGVLQLQELGRNRVVSAEIDVEGTSPTRAGDVTVFVSREAGSADLWIAQPGTPPRRLTTHASTDDEPALAPSGDRVAFVSSRSGTPRIWVQRLADSVATPLSTGSMTWVPERSPAWSPEGTRLSFSAVRGTASQVYVLAEGEAARAVTREPEGAYEPAWTADGRALVYVALRGGVPQLRRVAADGGEATDFATDAAGLGSPSCQREYCVAVHRPYTGNASLIFISGGRVLPLAAAAVGARDPLALP